MSSDTFKIGNRIFSSRLLVGTGKYKDFAETRAAVDAAGSEIITVADAPHQHRPGAGPAIPARMLPPGQFTLLPNTAGCYSADEAIRTLRLARELLDGHDLVKLEVLGDKDTLFPNMPETLKAAEVAGQGWLQGHGVLLG
jgi:thiazole synthase